MLTQITVPDMDRAKFRYKIHNLQFKGPQYKGLHKNKNQRNTQIMKINK